MTDLPSEIAEHPRYVHLKDEREIAASRAREAQGSFRKMTRGFVIGTALAAIAAGLVLYGIEENPEEASDQLIRWLAIPWVRVTLQSIQALGLFAAAFCGGMLAVRKYSDTWVENRLKAEEGRLDLQKLALELGHEAGGSSFEAAGHSFIAFAKAQLQYLKDRGTKHDRAAGLGAVAGALLAGLAALGGVIGGIQNVTLVALVALLGVCTPALVSALSTWSNATRDAARARLHDANRAALSTVLADQREFDAAIAANDLAGALAYAERVFAVLRADHSEFGKIHGYEKP